MVLGMEPLFIVSLAVVGLATQHVFRGASRGSRLKALDELRSDLSAIAAKSLGEHTSLAWAVMEEVDKTPAERLPSHVLELAWASLGGPDEPLARRLIRTVRASRWRKKYGR